MIVPCISKLVEGKDLLPSEAGDAMKEIMDGPATDAQIGAFLTALRIKGESVEEIVAFARVMRERAVKVEAGGNIVDTCGTGGDAIKTFNVSTAAAFVVAGAGVPVAKHGNRAVTSKAGSADVLETLGVNLNLQTGGVAEVFEKVGIAFLFAPLFHPAMKRVAGLRKEIKIRTVFNVLGPLTNPFGARRQVMGVYEEGLVVKMAEVLKGLGCERGFVVHGVGGIDEVSVVGKTLVGEVEGKSVKSRYYEPKDFGLMVSKVGEILGGSAEENARFLVEVLRGERGAKRDVVVANAALGIIAGGKASGLKEGVRAAEESIDSGKALEKLRMLVKETGGKTELLERFLA